MFRCVFSVTLGLVSSDAGCGWHPARTGFRQQVGALSGCRLQGVVSHVEGVTVGRWARGSAIRRPREHADLAHRLCSAASQHAPEAPSPRDQWRRRLSQLIDAMDRGVVELGPAPPAPLMTSQQQLLSGARHMCHSKWGCGWTGAWQRLSASQSERCQTSSRPSMLTCQPQVVGHDDSQVPWSSALPGTSSCPCLGWCRVARLQTLFILHWCWAFVAARYRCAHEWTPGDTWCSLPLLTVRSRIINIHEKCCKMLPPLERARWPHYPMDLPHARVYRARQQGCAGQNLQGRVREGVARSQRPHRRHCQHRPEHPRLAQPSHGMDTRRAAGVRDDAPQHSSLVRHRLHRCPAGRRLRFCHTAPHRRHGLHASPPPCGAGGPHHRGRGPTRA